MPSSTSSSDSSRQGLKIALQTSIAGLILFGSVVLAFRGFASLAREGEDRIMMQIGFLPELVSGQPGKKKVIVFGSSIVQAGFEPFSFDQVTAEKGVESVSYNYGMAGLNPEFQEIFSRRIQEAFEASGQTLDLALIEFNPFQNTKVRKRATAFIEDQNVATLSSNGELWGITLRDPTRGVRLFNIKYLRAGISAELFTTVLAKGFSDDSPPRSEAYIAAMQRRRRLERQFALALRKDLPGHQASPWERELRGGRYDKTTLSLATLKVLKNLMASRRYSGFLEVDLQRRIDNADILDLDFDRELVDAFIQLVKNFQSFSHHVEVLLLPRNTDWVNYTPAVRERLDAVLLAISEQTKVVIKDYQVHPLIGPKQFVDATHLSVYDGADIFSKLLAEDYAEVLRD